MSSFRKPRTIRRGTSLLDVIGALVCSSIVLVPTAVAITDANQWTSRIESKHQMRLLCESILDAEEQYLIQDFKTGNRAGDFSTLGRPDIRYSLVSDDRGPEAMRNRLMNTTVVAFWDANGNRTQDAGEPSFQATSQCARRK